MNADDSTPLRIMIAGGGTGGHLYLGIALGRELLRRDPATDLVFVGTRRGLESRIVPLEGFRLEFIVSAGLKGMNPMDLCRNALLIPGSLMQSRRLIRQYLPDVVVGVGGYASGPVVLAAWWLGRPTLVIEPNAQPGFTNRILARVVDRAALAWPDDARHFGSKSVVTGIPVRREFVETTRREAGAGMTVLIYGGSQGSHALNAIVCAALGDLKDLGPSLHMIHQTGERELEAVRQAYRNAGISADVRAFLPKIYEEFGRADLIICRAGAATVAELCAAGKAAILVPFARAADDHQTKNAQTLEALGAAVMIPEKAWERGRLARELRSFMDRPDALRRMEAAARKHARPDAAARIADLVKDLASAKPIPREKSEVREASSGPHRPDMGRRR
jgi:UDP-N-acetylglucosamine--N-acetylmuramyl-(pentapeptide) pyrophosphoryl-undecaprenol N-acetylglucosamine transferase